MDLLPADMARQMTTAYADENQIVNLAPFFDLLAIHELGHAFQQAAGMVKQ